MRRVNTANSAVVIVIEEVEFGPLAEKVISYYRLLSNVFSRTFHSVFFSFATESKYGTICVKNIDSLTSILSLVCYGRRGGLVLRYMDG